MASVPTTATTVDTGQMTAVLQEKYGNAEVLRVGRIDHPVVADDEVLVEVRAAGLDRGVWHLMTGVPYAARLAFGLRAPKNPVPGMDLAGVVTAIGSKVTRFALGDEVYGVGEGSFAQFAAAKETKLARKPSRLSFEQAAAVPISGLTAQQGLLDVGRLVAGQHVLITGASGGVGTFAVQIAKAVGATVTGVCSTSKVDLVRTLGADHVIDYTTTDFADTDFTRTGQRYDLIFDLGGSATLRRLRSVLTERGTLVIGGGEGGGKILGIGRQLRAVALSPFIRQRLAMFVGTDHHEPLERLTKMIDDGRVTPAIDEVFPLQQAAEAMRRLEAGRVRGKVVLVP